MQKPADALTQIDLLSIINFFAFQGKAGKQFSKTNHMSGNATSCYNESYRYNDHNKSEPLLGSECLSKNGHTEKYGSDRF